MQLLQSFKLFNRIKQGFLKCLVVIQVLGGRGLLEEAKLQLQTGVELVL